MIRPVPIGTVLGRALAACGISETRIARLFGAKNCGCGQRMASLDAWGNRVQYRIIMYLGGPAKMTWRARLRFVRRRLWKTIASN
jgi:hypothetical protein